jgi:hypothetical protein
MSKELDNAFVDVRNAFRLLARYQSRVLDIINYIREQSPFTDMWGLRRFCNVISTRKNCPGDNYATLRLYSDMWAWDFMYNYIFEYYFGQVKIQRKVIDMSVIQVSDDGFYKSMSSKPSQTDISTFIPAEEANSYLVLTAGWKAWMRDEQENDYDAFLHKFLSGTNDLSIYIDDKGYWAITKRYPMQRFSSQKEADKVLADFGKIVKDNTGIELFKK